MDGLAWVKTIAAIKRFQSSNLGHKWPDGRVDPGGKSFTRLNDDDTPAPSPTPPKDPPSQQLIYFVPGNKAVIGQPSMTTCWATVYTMMRSWREGKEFAIAEALEKPGQPYVEMFKKNQGLLPSQFREFWTRAGLTVRGYATFPEYIWYDFDFETKYNLAMSFGGGAHWRSHTTSERVRRQTKLDTLDAVSWRRFQANQPLETAGCRRAPAPGVSRDALHATDCCCGIRDSGGARVRRPAGSTAILSKGEDGGQEKVLT